MMNMAQQAYINARRRMDLNPWDEAATKQWRCAYAALSDEEWDDALNLFEQLDAPSHYYS